MFTVCSKCDLRLTVTPTDLRAAQGYVRCGRCHNVFNALAALSEETADTTGAHRTNTATPAPHTTTSTGPSPASAPEPTQTAKSAPAPADADLEFNAAATDISSIFVAAPETPNTGTFESIILRGSQPDDNTDEVRVLHLPSEELAALAAVAEAAVREEELARNQEIPAPIDLADTDEHTDAAESAILWEPLAEIEPTAPQHLLDELELADPFPATEPEAPYTAVPEALNESAPQAAGLEASFEAGVDAQTGPTADPFTAPAPPRVSGLPAWLPAAACAVLALALAAQMVNHWRDRLATGSLHRPIRALYAGLGIPLSPHWDVASYEVRQLGAQAAASSDNLEVHASIRNKARYTQPLPLLRVTLEDQFGNRIAARDLTPAEYLGKAAAGGMLAPYAQVEAAAAFVDPGQNAVGFELDACLKLRAGRIVCANDPARPAP